MKNEIKKVVYSAIDSLQHAGTWPVFGIPEIKIDYPASEKFGDYYTNVAMVIAKKIGKNPMEIAEELRLNLGALKLNLRIEVVAPGYINFYLSEEYLQSLLCIIDKEKENFGNSEIGKGVKVNNEFISANPTGPLTVGNGRGGFCGDALSNILRKAGFEVVSEYYINDAGEQLMKLGHSILKDKEAVYGGEYIDELNGVLADFIEKHGKGDIAKIGTEGATLVLSRIIATVEEKMQIKFDSWVSEKKGLQETGLIEEAVKILKEKKLTYESEGALWLKTTDFGDDKDRVLIKSNGDKTYFASDCGYILYKIERGFQKIIEIWGADHHGYVSRFKAAAGALGFKGDLKFIIVQLVRLVKDGKEARMSKRAGNVVYIDELIDEVGHDVARFFFLMYSQDTHMNFDLGLAKERSEKNPVYYVQYAHARICSILRKVEDLPHPALRATLSQGERGLLIHEKELSLMKELNKFPELVEEIAERCAVHKLPQYAIKLADKFHSFYNDCRVIDAENPELTSARLLLVNAVRIVLAETLRLIGVKAPEKM